jgi:hypothetical protein
MESILHNRDASIAITLVLVLGLPLVTWGIGYFWYKIHRDDNLTALKQQMLARGMSADEIRTVIEAGNNATNDLEEAVGGQPSGHG